MNYDVEPTAQVIDAMVKTLEQTGKELARVAERMRQKNDLTYAKEAIGCISNTMNALRLDLLVTRPLRETMRDK